MIQIRFAQTDDAEALLEIYAHYVLNTAISFEYNVPSLDEFRKRIKNISKEYPYLVAEADGDVVGFAYASSFHSREAYKHSAEASIYVEKDKRKQGIGKALYSKLEEYLLLQNVFCIHACVAYTSRKDDRFLTDASLRFHKKVGFIEEGVFEHCGYKFDQWYDTVWMKKDLFALPEHPDAFIPFAAVDACI